jgi:DNA-binding NarL/FixJ family response regulator
MNNTIKLLVADDHPIFLEGIAALISSIPHFELLGVANNGQELIKKIEKTQPNVILLDINMPEMDGIETLKYIKDKFPQSKVIMLTMFNEARMIREALEAGAKGYILKNINREDLITAIETVNGGKPFLDAAVQEKMIESIAHPNANDNIISDELLETITQREMEILQLIAQGLTSHDIAEKLFISKNTVETHRKNLLTKLNVKNTAGLLQIAFKKGIV